MACDNWCCCPLTRKFFPYFDWISRESGFVQNMNDPVFLTKFKADQCAAVKTSVCRVII